MKAHWQYLKYVLRHKWFVLQAGLSLGLPLLILIFHDWDKFLPDEWGPYVRTFYNPDGSKKDYAPTPEFTCAWMKHQHRNKHHWQYWLNAGATALPDTNILVWDKGTASIVIDGAVYDWSGEITVRKPMPLFYVLEMVADWVGAGQALGMPDTLGWYIKNRENMRLHPDTRALVEYLLGFIEYEKPKGKPKNEEMIEEAES